MTAHARPAHPSNRRLVSRNMPAVENTRRPVEDRGDHKPWDPEALWRGLWLAARIVLAVGVLAAGIAAAVFARRYVTHSPRFALKDLRVAGARHHTPERIATIAGVALGQNVVELDLEGARARLEKDPWIERATIVRRLPASLSIDVIERSAAALVALPTGTFLATAQGELFKRLEDGDPNDFPIVTGIAAEDAGDDRDATAQLVRRALDLGLEIERVGVFGGRVMELHVDPDGGITAVLGRRAVRVAFGRASYKQKVRTALRVETELVRRNARPTAIFLDDDQHPERVVVRLVAALPPAQVTVDGPVDPKAPPAGGKIK